MSNPNTSTTETTSSNITLTDSAAIKINELIKEEENPKLNLRVFIRGGGCSGFQYGFMFDEAINEDDICVTKKVKQSKVNETAEEEEDDDEERGADTTGSEVKLIVDSMSFQYLVGAEIDYKSDVKGEQFIIRNPLAKTTCGCGSSFSA